MKNTDIVFLIEQADMLSVQVMTHPFPHFENKSV